MHTLSCKADSDWLAQVSQRVRDVGYAIVTDVLDSTFLSQTRERMVRVQALILEEMGSERLKAARELGVLRLMCKYDPFFFRFIEAPEIVSVVDRLLSPTAIMHLQNGFILPSFDSGQSPAVFQNIFHRDFNRYLNGYLASINILIAIDEFRADNGATLAVPGSHQKPEMPDPKYMEDAAIALECPAGSMVVFDSTLWHAAGMNKSGRDRLAINHQFTSSYIKQQFDYVRALGEERVVSLPPRVQQLLGYYARVVTSLDEYYRPEAERLYRKNQG